jgi:hypothetical protein
MDDRRPWRVLLPFFGGLILTGIGGVLELPWLKGTGSGLAGVGMMLGIVDSLRAGVIRTNRGEILRESSPLRFRFEAAFWIVLAAAWMVLSALYALGLVGRPA